MAEIVQIGQAAGEKFKHPYRGSDYTQFFGGVDPFLPDEKDPFRGEVPKDPRMYTVYKDYYLDQWYKVTKGDGILKVSATCEGWDERGNPKPLRRVRPNHLGNTITICCPHVYYNDPINPWPVNCYPLRKDEPYCYFLCKSCTEAMEHKRLNLDILHAQCGLCVLEAINKLKAKDPGLFRDLRLVKG